MSASAPVASSAPQSGQSPMISDKSIEQVTFITAKPFIQRLDVGPFVTLYGVTIGAYLNVTQESYQIAAMIAILVAIVLHTAVLLTEYWHVTVRMALAYNTHTKEEVLAQFSTFNSDRFISGVLQSQSDYDSELGFHKTWRMIWEKKVAAMQAQHTKMVENYNRNPTNSIPPGPFIPPERPTEPQLNRPYVIFNESILEVCIVPFKPNSPSISPVRFDASDSSRIQFKIEGLINPNQLTNNSMANQIRQTKVVLAGPKRYPPFEFSHHHAQYTMEVAPDAQITAKSDQKLTQTTTGTHDANQRQSTSTLLTAVAPQDAKFQARQYPDNDKLHDYLTHKHTTTLPTPDGDVMAAFARNPSTVIATSKNSFYLTDLYRTAASTASFAYRLLQYGTNSFTVPIPGFISLFIENAMSPFFVFQIACVLLWLLDEYWYYSLFTLVMLVVIECVMVYKRQSHLSQMLGEKPALPHLHVYRHFETATATADGIESVVEQQLGIDGKQTPMGGWLFVPTKQLVPGDIVAMPIYTTSQQINAVYGNPKSGDEPVDVGSSAFLNTSVRPTLFTADVPCDMLLLSGSCVCDESMLTGESVPQVKEDLISLQTAADVGNNDSQGKNDAIFEKKKKNDQKGDKNDKNDQNNDDHDDLQQPLDDRFHKRHQLYSGTKLIGIQRNYQHSLFQFEMDQDKPKNKSTKNAQNAQNSNKTAQNPDSSFLTLLGRPPLPSDTEVVLCRVLRTGFGTTQGSLVRTILTASNNGLVDKEALYFILGLLCCAILSAYYVAVEGLADPTRSRYKLLLNVITILTSVVPPELPLQLSMAVNNALGSLAKTQVFCTEPNRLPSAGQIDICCFDKTGTLCADKFLLACSVTPAVSLENLEKSEKSDKSEKKTTKLSKSQKSDISKVTYLRMQLDKLVNIVDEQDDKQASDDDSHGDGDGDSDHERDDIDQNDTENGSPKSFQNSQSQQKPDGLDLSHLPIDTRLILGCAQELAMLQMPPKTTVDEFGNAVVKQQGQKIVGDPMEAAGFNCAGFEFFPRKALSHLSSSSSSSPSQGPQSAQDSPQDNSNTRVFFEANPVRFEREGNRYVVVGSDEKRNKQGQNSQNSQNSEQKLRIDTEILHRFTFQSQLQRMSSVISLAPPRNQALFDEMSALAGQNTENGDNSQTCWLNSTLPVSLQSLASQTHLRVVTKGSPEMIYHSLHPAYRPDFKEYTKQHKNLARHGLRVLALAWKPLYMDPTTQTLCDIPDPASSDAQNGNVVGSQEGFEMWSKANPNRTLAQFNSTLNVPSRDQSESKLFFAGIIGFNSPLKTQSLEVIKHLKESDHTPIVITGDHLLTAIAVAKSLQIAKPRCLLLSKQFLDGAGNPASPGSPGGSNTDGVKLVWRNEHEEYVSDFTPNDPLFTQIYSRTDTTTSLCINGDALTTVIEQYPASLPLLCSVTSVFARTLPDQKERILQYLREHVGPNGPQTCLMCGDGTNDVGALAHANIGIALSSVDTDSSEQVEAQAQRLKQMSNNPIIKRYLDSAQKLREKGFVPQAANMEQQAHDMFKRLQQSQLGSLNTMMGEMDMEDDDPGTVKLGDASLAASFSAKHGSIRCVLDVIRQGRCALATTGQMYQILALQCLIAAYSLAALYFKGVRQSESQMTIGGLVATAMSTLLSYSQPLEKISSRRPNSRIFSAYNITTIGLQFAVHLGLLMYMVNCAMEFTDAALMRQNVLEDDMLVGTFSGVSTMVNDIANSTSSSISSTVGNVVDVVDAVGAGVDAVGDSLSRLQSVIAEESAAAATAAVTAVAQGTEAVVSKYVPTVLNSVVFILSTAMSATTILSNYVGFPFMTPLTMTKLFKVILGTLGGCIALSLEIVPELNTYLEMSPMPTEDFGLLLAGVIVADCVLSVLIGVGTKLFFGIVTWEDLTKPLPPDVISRAMVTSGTPGTGAGSTVTATATAASSPKSNQNKTSKNNNNTKKQKKD